MQYLAKKRTKYRVRRKIYRLIKKEFLFYLFIGAFLFFLLSFIISYLVVSNKKPITISDWKDMDIVYINVADAKGNFIGKEALKDLELELKNLNVSYKTFAFTDESDADIVTTFEDFCKNIDFKRIGIVSFDYLIPYLTYNCSQKGKIVYGQSFQVQVEEKFTIFEKIFYSFKFFLM